MAKRRWVPVAVVLSLLSLNIWAESRKPVTEADAVRLFLERSPQARRIPLIERFAGAEWRRQALVANPEVAYELEDAGGVRDEFLTFRQELPITGRRRLARETADAAASAARLAAKRDLVEAAYMVRASFYEVLYREEAVDLLRRGSQRLRRIVDILAVREREGESAGYDLLRAEQELAEIRIAASEADVDLAAARSRFGSFFDPAREMGSAVLAGDIEPTDALPDLDDAFARALSQRTDLRAVRAEIERLNLEEKAARSQRIPEPTLTAGWKRTESMDLDDTGFVAGLTVPLPVFDRGQVTAARARADRGRAALEAEVLTREIRADVNAVLAREKAARQAARRHAKAVDRRAGELRRIAELAYEEGETGILELLDAYRTSLATELRVLTLRYEARRAQIDRQRAIGTEVKP
jgi:cobalt-zinc-cadmium efflux system outer membrane protein